MPEMRCGMAHADENPGAPHEERLPAARRGVVCDLDMLGIGIALIGVGIICMVLGGRRSPAGRDKVLTGSELLDATAQPREPGHWLAFAGYAMVLAGIMVVLVNQIT